MSPPPQTRATPEEALAALERLFRKNVITQEEGAAAARLITGDPNTPFPPPARAEPAPAEGPAAEGGPGGAPPEGLQGP